MSPKPSPCEGFFHFLFKNHASGSSPADVNPKPSPCEYVLRFYLKIMLQEALQYVYMVENHLPVMENETYIYIYTYTANNYLIYILLLVFVLVLKNLLPMMVFGFSP